MNNEAVISSCDKMSFMCCHDFHNIHSTDLTLGLHVIFVIVSKHNYLPIAWYIIYVLYRRKYICKSNFYVNVPKFSKFNNIQYIIRACY